MKSTPLQNAPFASGMSFGTACAGALSRVARRGNRVPQAPLRCDVAAESTDASGLRPVAKAPRPQLNICWRRRYDEFWLAPLITGALFVWVRLGLAVCGISPLL